MRNVWVGRKCTRTPTKPHRIPQEIFFPNKFPYLMQCKANLVEENEVFLTYLLTVSKNEFFTA